MNKVIVFAFLALSLISCGSKKSASSTSSVKNSSSYKSAAPKISRIIDYALDFQGTKYKYGGTTRKGMDCSGLIYTAFLSENVALPRVSRDMARQGVMLRANQINVGDLLFFQTNKNRDVINHVGLVVEIGPSQISFIHSTTSRGVIVSKLSERYWNDAFIMAKRIL
ncbi:Cell wall-associated hydrolase, NlpC family [Mesonia phycicola]|uniref:Cell wall-associated hydrolase, NlpC family n=1 Tax=Mesonia phycicola TaxID=579105 RepID=A0A1M6HH02_9FLAO|nr:C40 family peptidase [Mesonia phycicola]SHJ21421.1 Cell wall-associated hydrolase, NlpC family [Mesonia phycicola]